MTESGPFLRRLREYDAFKRTPEGKAQIEEIQQAMLDENYDLAFYPPSEEELQIHKNMEMNGLETRLYFYSICPHCGEKSEYSIQNTELAILGLMGICGICPKCHKRYPVLDNIVKEKPKELIGCLTILFIIVVVIVICKNL